MSTVYNIFYKNRVSPSDNTEYFLKCYVDLYDDFYHDMSINPLYDVYQGQNCIIPSITFPHNSSEGIISYYGITDSKKFPYYYTYDASAINFTLLRVNGNSFSIDIIENPLNFPTSELEKFISLRNGFVYKRQGQSAKYVRIVYETVDLVTESGISQSLFDQQFTMINNATSKRDFGVLNLEYGKVYTLYSDDDTFIGDFTISEIKFNSNMFLYCFNGVNQEGKNNITLNFNEDKKYIYQLFRPLQKLIMDIISASYRYTALSTFSITTEQIRINNSYSSSLLNINDTYFSINDCGYKLRNGYIEFDKKGIFSKHCIGYNKTIGEEFQIPG